ncbi:Tyrosine kinase receptor Cad96Ca [Frankliniella fusca]|uniref:receptor protein-tyrosine kinase n=1 Tax=Frankliniella fusca TaxID=407009 RepID=A0AAE1HIE7_9NEOP|nr:Tyrosine kinase receptor Cad96Ca [Frankliniella fusca]
MHIDRDWQISDAEPVGSVVTRVRASDAEGDALKFGLEPLQLYPHPQGEPPPPLPFTIDEDSGVVHTNASLKDRGGELMRLYVTVSDGTVTAKNEVVVKVTSGPVSGGGGGGAGSSRRPPRPPNFPPQLGGSSRLRPPPFLPFPTNFVPPGVPAAPIHPGVPVVNPGPPPSLPPITATAGRPPPPPIWPTRAPAADRNTTTTTTTTSSQAPSEPALVPSVVPTQGGAPGGAPGGDTVATPSLPESLLLTVVLAVLCIALVLAGGLVMLRRRLCARRPAKASKEDLHKEASGLSSGLSSGHSSGLSSGLSSSGMSADEPMAMQQWCGPRAFSNRYEGWETNSGGAGGNPANPAGPIKPPDRWEFPRRRLTVYDILGEGCFGQVWRCEAVNIDGKEGKSTVAVKTLKKNAGEKERTDLLQELAVMKTLEPHPNVVRLLGCCTEEDPLFVIMEFVARGKLQSFLRSSRAERDYGNLHGPSRTLTSRDLTSFLYQVAKGMEFLSSKGIIHRDLAARNVLVTEDRTCKVADFGFARDLMDNHVYERKSEGRLPIRWMAPESLYDNVFSVKSDVWSFGVLMWEVVTLGSTPYPGMGAADVMRKVRDGYRLDKPEHCRRELYNIMFYCWDRDPKERPYFSELVQRTEELLLTETDYIELERFPDHSYYNMSSLSGEKL